MTYEYMNYLVEKLRESNTDEKLIEKFIEMCNKEIVESIEKEEEITFEICDYDYQRKYGDYHNNIIKGKFLLQNYGVNRFIDYDGNGHVIYKYYTMKYFNKNNMVLNKGDVIVNTIEVSVNGKTRQYPLKAIKIIK